MSKLTAHILSATHIYGFDVSVIDQVLSQPWVQDFMKHDNIESWFLAPDSNI